MTRPANNSANSASGLSPDDLHALFDVSDHGLEDYAETIGPDYNGAKRAILANARAPSDDTRREAARSLDTLLEVHTIDISDERAVHSILERVRTAGRAERAAIIEALKDLLDLGAPPLPLSAAPELEPQWLIEDWMPLGDAGALAIDDSAAEAAALPLQIANAVATGSPAFASPEDREHTDSPGVARRVLLISWRDRPPTTAKRLHAICRHFNRAGASNVTDRIYYKDALGAGRLWETTRGRPRQRSALSALGRDIRREAESLGAALLIADPLQMALDTTDSSTADTAALIDDWRAWSNDANITTLFVARPRSDDAWRDLPGFSWRLESPTQPDRRMTLRLERSETYPLSSAPRPLRLTAETSRDPNTGHIQRVLRNIAADPANAASSQSTR